MWIEPKAHQILKYTFDNVGFDFLPAQWLVHVSDVKATMKVAQPFPDVWLPDSLDVNVALVRRNAALAAQIAARIAS